MEDIPALLAHFMSMLSQRLGVAPLEPTEREIQALCAYHWPGNVRELRNLVERSLILGALAIDALQESAAVASKPTVDSELSLEAVERRHILGALDACGGNKTEAAKRLGVSRKTLDRKCAEWSEGVA